ncbi:MAG: ABC transporter ATP-binding protein [Sedimentibacter sp.]|uniref:ABC transporter ATP-binding protein n=1 Tax=Sedimentibacter sp. TaxID=1960295 RepID=UPI002980F89F|nr:ABC transporter ATP-binding protein [Sedimentibacter sp.]MDW5299125.1 ABC transporter ATP-binding protein [Sedimentibacter sp.]
MIEIKNLNINLGGFMLENINFKVNEGEFFIVLGPTGAGKSIIVETIAGVLKPDSGQIIINNIDVTNLKPEKRNVSICYQDYILFPNMSVEENIEYGLKYKKVNDKELFNRLVKLLKIDHLLKRYPTNLSGGEKQRVSLARSLIVKPEVLLLDEPFAALDAHIKDTLMRDLKQLHSEFGMTTIMITHSFQEAFFLGESGCVINKGKVLQTGTMKEIFIHPNSTFVSDFVGLKNVFKAEMFDNIKTDAPYVGIRPESVRISSEKTENSYKGKIYEISDMGNYYELIILTKFGNITAMAMIYDYINGCFDIKKDIYFSFDKKEVLEIYNYQKES